MKGAWKGRGRGVEGAWKGRGRGVERAWLYLHIGLLQDRGNVHWNISYKQNHHQLHNLTEKTVCLEK